MKTATALDDLYNIPDNGKAEIINGEVVLMSPTGFLPGRAAGAIYVSLREYERQIDDGYAFGDNVGFVVALPHRRSFSPDAAFYRGPTTGMRFLEGAPVFAVEVRSEGDYGTRAEREIARKRNDYFSAGTRVVWDVDLLSADVVKSYAAENPSVPRIYRRGDIAEAEPALASWRLAVEEIFR